MIWARASLHGSLRDDLLHHSVHVLGGGLPALCRHLVEKYLFARFCEKEIGAGAVHYLIVAGDDEIAYRGREGHQRMLQFAAESILLLDCCLSCRRPRLTSRRTWLPAYHLSLAKSSR